MPAFPPPSTRPLEILTRKLQNKAADREFYLTGDINTTDQLEILDDLVFGDTTSDTATITTATITTENVTTANETTANITTANITTLKVGTTNQGDVLYDNGTSIVRLTPGTSGHFLKTNGVGANPAWASAGSVTAVDIVPLGQGTTQTLDTTTLTNSNTFALTVGTNQVWVADLDIIFVGSTANTINTEGFKWAFTGPTGWGGVYGYQVYKDIIGAAAWPEVAPTVVTSPTSTQSVTAGTLSSTPNNAIVKMRGRLTTGANAGTITFQFAKETDTGSETVGIRAGSTAVFTRVS